MNDLNVRQETIRILQDSLFFNQEIDKLLDKPVGCTHYSMENLGVGEDLTHHQTHLPIWCVAISLLFHCATCLVLPPARRQSLLNWVRVLQAKIGPLVLFWVLLLHASLPTQVLAGSACIFPVCFVWAWLLQTKESLITIDCPPALPPASLPWACDTLVVVSSKAEPISWMISLSSGHLVRSLLQPQNLTGWDWNSGTY